MKQFLNKTWKILKDSGKNFKGDEPIVYSAAIAFFTIFSLPAILIVITLIGSLFFNEEDVKSELIGKIENLISDEAGDQAGTVLENVLDAPTGFWGVLIGIIVVIKSATIIFFIVQKALNSIWQVKVKAGVNYFRLLKYRLVALAMVIGLGLLFATSLLLDTLVSVYSQELSNIFEEYFTPAIRTINTVFYISVILIFFTAVHRVLPDAKVSWKDALAGGVITSVLFLIGKQIINYILSNVEVIGVYAAAGSLVVLLLWVFYSSIILLLGAEVTKSYANNHGRKVEPNPIAVKYREISMEEE
ncbi:YihY/virulence factor BrkB family protein [Pontibacter diazotrophicus]|uniref:YihY/virulence factor BrkB family protein n=1 Tax=Pontibacter diazotrophicus TaxID=1400979 RepID=UPI0015F17BC2|nr:YihY/virulence factor BrkB family protein [Pontibacter diazotrophicus]